MLYFLLFNLLLVNSFTLKWDIPQGIDWGGGRILIEDTDRDSNFEFIFTTYGGPFEIYVYELHLPNTWEVDSVYYPYSPILWDSGDFDLDGFYDLALQCGNISPYWSGISIIESPDSFSYPTQEVWRDTVGPGLVLPICAYDIDQDGLPEIVKNRATPYGYVGIYESVGDNQYELIFADDPDTTGNDAPAATIAFGDFDIDGKNEFVLSGGNEWYWIYECIGNNDYEKVDEGQLPTSNIRDCFTVSDADGDGKDEFVVKGFTFPDGKFQVFIFEAIGDNTYEIIDTLIFTGFSNSYYGGYSAVGDVDGDGIPEIALEGSYRVYMIKADSNNCFSVFDTLPGNGSGSSVAVYDIDDNGLEEVIISGNNETRIYEYVEEGVEEVENSQIKLKNVELTVFPNPFSTSTDITVSSAQGHKSTGAQAEDIELNIYDLSGRLMKTLALGTGHSASGTTVTWQGRDKRGKKVPTGLYFIKLKIGDKDIKKKIIYVK